MPLVHLTDFPDRFSPMLVKELRQGMRARGFTLLFLIFQCLLALILLMTGSAADPENAGTAASSVIFTLFSIAVLIVQPMRGMSALSSEIAGNTIEMMALTRLNAWRIVFGKWVAIVSQSGLILTSIVPYLILRYFYGGMILLGEMVALTLVFLTSMALSAVTVGLSAFASKLLRALFTAGMLIGGFTLGVQALAMMFRGRMSGPSMSTFALSDWESVVGTLAYIMFIAYLGWCALSQGTAAIAPAAENHTTIRRVIALGLAAAYAFAGLFFSIERGISIAVYVVILTPAILVAVTEPLILLPPVFKPFVKRGLIGKAAGHVLLPGWPSGVIFSTLILAIFVGGMLVARVSDTSFTVTQFLSAISDHPEVVTVMLSLLGGVLLAALLAVFFTKVEGKRFLVFLLMLVALGMIALVVGILANSKSGNESYLWLFVWNPLTFLAMVDVYGFDKSLLLQVALIVDAVILGTLISVAIFKFKEYRRVMTEAEIELANEAAKTAATS